MARPWFGRCSGRGDTDSKYRDRATKRLAPRPKRLLKKLRAKVRALRRKYGASAEVWFFDEGRFGLKPCTGRAWCRRARRPVTKVRPGYKNFYLFAAVNPVTGAEFTLQLPSVDAEMMSLYLSHMRRENPRKRILLVLDCAGWHKAKDLVLPRGIELFYLPPYSPELNPVERLWQWLRRHVCRNRLFGSLNDLEDAIVQEWHLIQPGLLKTLCNCNYL